MINYIELDSINKYVLKDFHITFAKHSFTTILGPSGSGKSTILNALAGITNPDSGRIILNNRDITNLPPNKRNLGMVFQNYALFPHMTALENVQFPLKLRGVPFDISFEILEKLEMSNYYNMYPHQLSGGQQQRVALARALVYNPDIILLDEPFGSLDVLLRNQLQNVIKTIHDETGATMINVTHDIAEAFILSDTIVILKNGEVQQIGSPKEIYNNPADAWVKSFIKGGLDHVHKLSEVL